MNINKLIYFIIISIKSLLQTQLFQGYNVFLTWYYVFNIEKWLSL